MEQFIPKKVEKEVISIRIASDFLKDIDRKAGIADISRNEFIIQCIEFAVKHMSDAHGS